MSKNRETHRVDVGRTQTWCHELLAGRVITHGHGVDRVADRSIRWTTSGVYRCSACYRTRRDERRAEQSAASRQGAVVLAAAAAVALLLLSPAMAWASTVPSPGSSAWWVAPLVLAVAGCLPQPEAVTALLELLKSPPDDFERQLGAIADRAAAGPPVTLAALQRAAREMRASERAAVLEGVAQLVAELAVTAAAAQKLSVDLVVQGSTAGSYELTDASVRVGWIADKLDAVAVELRVADQGAGALASCAALLAGWAVQVDLVADKLCQAEGLVRALAVDLRTLHTGLAAAAERLGGAT